MDAQQDALSHAGGKVAATRAAIGAHSMNTKTTHTPGPWEAVYNDAYTITHPTGERTYRYIATTDSQADHTTPIHLEDKQEDEANAVLIAAAPDLLTALRGFESWGTRQTENGKGTHTLNSLLDLARAAIARAEGC